MAGKSNYVQCLLSQETDILFPSRFQNFPNTYFMKILIKTEKAFVSMMVITVKMRIEDIYDDIDNLDVLGTIPQEERQALPNLESRAGEQMSLKIFQPSVIMFQQSVMIIQLSVMIIQLSVMIIQQSVVIFQQSVMIIQLSVMIIQQSVMIIQLSVKIIYPSAVIFQRSVIIFQLKGEDAK